MIRWLPLLMVLAGCRTSPFDFDGGGGGGPSDGAVARDGGCDAGALSNSHTNGTVSCAARACSVPNGEPCCINPASPTSSSCGPGGCPPNQQALFCDGPEDCKSGVCCLPIQNTIAPAQCAQACASGFVLCHQAADCPPGNVCAAQAMLPLGVGACSATTCQ